MSPASPCAGVTRQLSQWLAYSLFEPFEWAGYTIADRDALTALPEYRNGGLLIDSGVLQLTDEADRNAVWDVGSEIIVEWRALTVSLLDDLAEFVRAELDRPQLPLACVLEGGTWAAGRAFASRLRGGAAFEGALRRNSVLRLRTALSSDRRFAERVAPA